jgi:peptide/nickel transport system permease protein
MLEIRRKSADMTAEERYYLASQWELMWRKFKKHGLAKLSLVLLGCFYVMAIFCEFIAPYGLESYNRRYTYCPPQRLHYFDENGFHLRPFVYGIKAERNPKTLRRHYSVDRTQQYPLRFFVRAEEYEFWGEWKTDRHLFGVDGDQGVVFLLGTDKMGRDLLSRIIYGARISLSIGLIGVLLSLILGIIIGGISGYFGGVLDTGIQRLIEIIRSFPTIPLWMALSAALPMHMPPVQVYFGITIILSLIGWTELARVVRGKFVALREEDYVMAAKIAGCTDARIIRTHLVPGFLSYIIVNLTLSIPRMILAETSLSFLGLGLRSPVTSWGVLLKEAQTVQTISLYPWLLLPVLCVVITVLAFNFLGDGLRDAADPYK